MNTKLPERGIEILLVEDNPADVRWTREALREGCIQNTTNVVPDGESALHYLRREGQFVRARRPDLILLDLNLPRKSGSEVLADVKTDASLRDIPVVVLTSSPIERQSLLKAYHLPSDTYLLKPLTFRRFLDAVRCYDRLKALIAPAQSPAASAR